MNSTTVPEHRVSENRVEPIGYATLLVMLLVAVRRLTLAANKFWTRRYVESTIPAP